MDAQPLNKYAIGFKHTLDAVKYWNNKCGAILDAVGKWQFENCAFVKKRESQIMILTMPLV